MAERDPLNLVGATIAEKYRIERMVGEGGFAVVYRAQHAIWNKPVAIKFFNGLSNAPSISAINSSRLSSRRCAADGAQQRDRRDRPGA